MTKFDTIFTSLYETVAGATAETAATQTQTSTSTPATTPSTTNSTTAVTKPALQPNDPRLQQAAKLLGIQDPGSLFKALTTAENTHEPKTQAVAQTQDSTTGNV
jgi:hypothetical protein